MCEAAALKETQFASEDAVERNGPYGEEAPLIAGIKPGLLHTLLSAVQQNRSTQ